VGDVVGGEKNEARRSPGEAGHRRADAEQEQPFPVVAPFRRRASEGQRRSRTQRQGQREQQQPDTHSRRSDDMPLQEGDQAGDTDIAGDRGRKPPVEKASLLGQKGGFGIRRRGRCGNAHPWPEEQLERSVYVRFANERMPDRPAGGSAPIV